MSPSPVPSKSGVVEGRWTICNPTWVEQRWTVEGPFTSADPIPVVPCDDEAVERVAQRLYDLSDERVRVDGVEWVNESDGYKGLWRDMAREVLRAAGERL